MKPGIYYDMPEREYHADPCDEPSLSSSIAVKLLHESAMHARHAHPKLNPHAPKEYKTEYDFGSGVHALVLEGENSRFLVYDDPNSTGWRKNVEKEFRDAAREAGKIPLLQNQYNKIARVSSSLKRQRPFVDGKPEVTMIWQEPNGVWCRIRIDWLLDSRERIEDLKTSQSANPNAFSRTIWSLHYDVQNGLYRRGLKALEGVESAFRWVVAEIEPPNGFCEFELDAAGIALADAKAEQAIQRWGHHLKTDDWPGYPDYTIWVEAPAWEMSRFEMEMGGEL